MSIHGVHTIATKMLLNAAVCISLNNSRESRFLKIRPDSESVAGTKNFDSDTEPGTQNPNSGSDSGSKSVRLLFRFRFWFYTPKKLTPIPVPKVL